MAVQLATEGSLLIIDRFSKKNARNERFTSPSSILELKNDQWSLVEARMRGNRSKRVDTVRPDSGDDVFFLGSGVTDTQQPRCIPTVALAGKLYPKTFLEHLLGLKD